MRIPPVLDAAAVSCRAADGFDGFITGIAIYLYHNQGIVRFTDQTGKGFTGSNQRNPAAGQDQKKQDTGGQQQGLVATVIYAFLQNWNEYMFASVLMSDDAKKTITYAISTMADAYRIQWNYLMCAAMISSVPTLVVFVAMQKYLIAGMTAGAVKE